MKLISLKLVVLSCAMLVGASVAQAAPMIGGNHVGAFTEISGSPVFMPVIGLNGGIVVGAGLGYKNGAANIAAGGADKSSLDGRLYGFYALVNEAPVAIGPELIYATPITPNGFKNHFVAPGLGAYFAPWNAPVVIGTGLNINVTIIDGASTQVTNSTGALRLIWMLN